MQQTDSIEADKGGGSASKKKGKVFQFWSLSALSMLEAAMVCSPFECCWQRATF